MTYELSFCVDGECTEYISVNGIRIGELLFEPTARANYYKDGAERYEWKVGLYDAEGRIDERITRFGISGRKNFPARRCDIADPMFQCPAYIKAKRYIGECVGGYFAERLHPKGRKKRK